MQKSTHTPKNKKKGNVLQQYNFFTHVHYEKHIGRFDRHVKKFGDYYLRGQLNRLSKIPSDPDLPY